ncbi:uncharacterized protein LOC120009924 isoform X2 [Tripterygium wilfordii]|uniref:uncharacterized protein LOC120009924 isoform X2 n=1 Tax=Tripterygium wilfordii TaxID=458696 RepID=UPI0018F85ECC|nr:uncharacterized protein LOC120009924 isoform X2 [Tripterygium wilfordii]
MDMSGSQWTSGCDSGWTLYLDQSSYSKTQCHSFGGAEEEAYRGGEGARMEHDEEDDLSMVSDASSGPRHCNADHDGCSGELEKGNKRNNKKKKKVKSREHCTNPHQYSSLDDTASSSVLGSPKDASFSRNDEASMDHVLDSSQGFSATNFRGKSALKNQLGLFPSFKESGSWRGRRKSQ